jgi:hypothetical protein
MTRIPAFLLFVLACQFSFGQRIGGAEEKFMQQKEDSLKLFAKKIITGINAADRFKADSLFTKTLVKALKTNNSFYYPFDSLESISRLYAPDSSFKIFTWQLLINEKVVRQHGAIQMKTYDGTLKLFPLIDRSDITQNANDTIANNFGWIGAIYYKIVLKKSMNQNFYTLLGFDENNIWSDKKVVEVLTFVNDEPIFGGRYFSFEDDKIFKSAMSRYVIEYKKNSPPKLNYDADLDMIITEHLIPENGETNKRYTYIPDGDYEGFKWKGGKWVHIEKIYNYVTPLGKEPVPEPLNQSGNLLDDKSKVEDPATGEKAKTPKTKKGKEE